ncbi:hypothetical protein [Hymenobacter profundi]|uniref:Lipocalin-like domain-containing protein n=1 Tax=Hymenobacter profundi TaxID=1982110 RepID=A0ABS6WYC4_9BACT|nr:hypothetical protein [Hymenobacter profundi]MBW3128541.1 hypothetical protein [Hymenobacter profundi]
MLRILSLLLLSIVLLTTACSRDNPEPEPTLEGTWKLQRAYSRTYNTNGTLTNESTIPPAVADETLTLTKDSLTLSKSLFGLLRFSTTSIEATPYTAHYTRQDQTLTIDLPLTSSYRFWPFTIVKLTSNTLQIEQEEIRSSSTGPFRLVTGGEYTR